MASVVLTMMLISLCKSRQMLVSEKVLGILFLTIYRELHGTFIDALIDYI